MVQLLKDGAVTQEYAYDAYGYINADEFGIRAPFYGYNGEEQNPFTGLQYLRARYYAPQNGGFITQDSFSGVLTNALSQNRYTYAHNNPVNYADPSGHSIWDSIKNGVTNAVNSVKNFVSNVANKVSSAVSSAVNAVKSAVTGTTTKTVANTSSAVKKSYTNTAVRQKIGSYAGGAAAAAAGSVSTSYSNSVVNGVVADSRIPFTNAAGQTISVPSHFSNLAEAAKDFVRRVCDAETKRIEAQQSVELEQQKILLGWLGNIGAFLQGTGTAIYDDAMGPLSNLYNDLTITSGFDTGLGTDYVPPVREPFMGKQDAMAWGRGFGHILTVVLGAATEVITIWTSAGLAGGSIALALPTGGTVTGPGVAAAGTVLVSGSVAAGSIVKAGVEGLFNDPNMQFNSNNSNNGSSLPVEEKTTARNGLNYQSNPKHTPGQAGNRPDAGIEPKNSLELFENSVPSSQNPNQRFAFDKETNTLHRFYNDGNGTWHWSGSTNQGANSLTGKQVPNDIKNIFGLPKKGW